MSENAFQQNYRDAIGLFATGVTVLIAEDQNEVYCMTANAVSSLSLDPTQLLVCPSKNSEFANHIGLGKIITVNILGKHQEDISNFFACHKSSDKKDEPLYNYLFSKKISSPRLKDCIASFACKIKYIHDGGDHWIVVGEILELYKNKDDIKPLLFFGGKYHYPLEEEVSLKPSADPYK